MQAPKTEHKNGTALSQLSARTKLVGTFILVLGCTLLPRQISSVYLVPVILLAVLWSLSGMPVAHAFRRMLVAEFFILGIGGLSLLSPSTPVFLSAFIKSNLSVFTLVLLTWTTPFSEILLELRHARVPGVMLSTLALMYRYLPVLAGEARRMERARASRTFVPRRRLAWRTLSEVIANLFIRSAERGDRIYQAMCARGWK